jgi:hypothetical protein
MEHLTNFERLIQHQLQEALSNFEDDAPTCRHQLRELLGNAFIPPITRARAYLMMAWIACDPEDGEVYLQACRDALAWNLEIGREPPVGDFESEMVRCAAELQQRRENPDDDYGLGEDDEGDLSHEAWIRWYSQEEQSSETLTGEPSVGLQSDPADDTLRVSTADDAEYDEEEPAALPTSDAQLMRSSSRPADEDSATSAFDPQSDALYEDVPDTNAPATDAPDTDVTDTDVPDEPHR